MKEVAFMAEKRSEKELREEEAKIAGIVDTFNNEDWVQGDCDSLPQAKELAEKEVAGKQMLKMYAYDEHGRLLHDCGSF